MGRSRCGGGLATSVIVWLTLRERERESVGKAFLCESESPRAQELRFLEISRPWLWLLVEHLWCVEVCFMVEMETLGLWSGASPRWLLQFPGGSAAGLWGALTGGLSRKPLCLLTSAY